MDMSIHNGPLRFRRGCAGVLCILSLALLFHPTSSAAEELTIVASVSDLASLAEAIGGDRVEVKTLAKGYMDPHYLEAKPSYARLMRKADLLLFIGLELEVGWLPRLIDTARNPKLRPGSEHLLEAATVIDEILEVPAGGIDRSQGDIHPFGNPHIMLDPRNALSVAEAIAERLGRLDPEGQAVYEERLLHFRAHLEANIEQWEEKAGALRGIPVVAYHKQWEYLADWLGLDLVNYIENRPGIPPSPRHIESLLSMMKDREVRLVIGATFIDVDALQEVARRGSAEAAVLPAGVGGVDGAETYESFIDTIVTRLLEGVS
jgi:zinc/manganese transport system substrate-binding protein